MGLSQSPSLACLPILWTEHALHPDHFNLSSTRARYRRIAGELGWWGIHTLQSWAQVLFSLDKTGCPLLLFGHLWMILKFRKP